MSGKPAARLGDIGSLPLSTLARSLAAGSPTVVINNKAAGRIGDANSCGGNHATGSPNVLIGSGSPPARTRAPVRGSCEDRASQG